MIMKYKDLKTQLKGINISDKSFSNYFNIELVNGNYQFVSNKTITIIGSESAYPDLYSEHTMSETDQWSLMAHNYFGTTDLWWVICKFNNISNPFIMPRPGTVIKIPSKDLVSFILKQLE